MTNPKPKKTRKVKCWVIKNNSSMIPFAVNWIRTPFGTLKSNSMIRVYLQKKDADEDRMRNGEIHGLLEVLPATLVIEE